MYPVISRSRAERATLLCGEEAELNRIPGAASRCHASIHRIRPREII